MIKICTSIPQSQKLIELGIDTNTADMVYIACEYLEIRDGVLEEDDIPAWSLAALLNILPNGVIMNKDSQNGKYHFSSRHIGTYITSDNPVDACYELILKLH